MDYIAKFPDTYLKLVEKAECLGLEKLRQEVQSKRPGLPEHGGRWPKLSPEQRAWVDVNKFLNRIHVNRHTNCWERTTKRGTVCKSYGAFKIEKVHFKTHVFSYAIFNGPVPCGLCVCHRCDNPPCVNPDHLFLGTQKDNMQDCWRKGRKLYIRKQDGELNSMSKLNRDIVKFIRENYVPPAEPWAKRYGVHIQTIFNVIYGKTWRTVC